MTLNIHPNAANNFNEKISGLIKLIEEFPFEKQNNEAFHSDLHVAALITEKDIIGDIEEEIVDYQGNTIQKFFYFNDKRFGLSKSNYSNLREIAERIKALPTVKVVLSLSFIEKKLFSWVSQKYRGINVPDLFLEYLDTEANAVIETITSWIPIANLEVETAFAVSGSEIRPFSKAVIDEWAAKVDTLTGDNKENALKEFEKIRKDYQGLAAVVTTTTSEPEYANDYALEEAQKITAILGIFSGATLIPDIKCVSNIKGSEFIAKSTTFLKGDKELFLMINSIRDKSCAEYWRLGQRDIIEMQKMGLNTISSLLASNSPTDFEKATLNAIFLYAKSAFTAEPIEKVVYMLSSLESILLKNENEPIQQNLAERIAVFTAQELDKRKAIIKTIKFIYGMRSRYLHHGHTSSELKLISEFMMQVWIFYIDLLKNVTRFRTKEEFVNAIDDYKLS